MIEIKEILRSNRKTISLTITPSGEVVVKAPLKAPDSAIYNFVNSKQDWINSRLEKINSALNDYKDVLSYTKFMFLGNIYDVYRSPKSTKIAIENNKVVVPMAWNTDKIYKKFIVFYKKAAQDILIARTKEIASILKLKPTEISISGSRGRWGACTNLGQIILSWRAIMLETDLIDYIIVHELMHLEELNHSPKFWANVQKIYPKYKLARNKMKSFGFILKMF